VEKDLPVGLLDEIVDFAVEAVVASAGNADGGEAVVVLVARQVADSGVQGSQRIIQQGDRQWAATSGGRTHILR